MAVVSRASPVRWGDMQVRPRRIEGASWQQIRCLHGRSVPRGRERVAPPETAARTAAPAAPSRLSGARSRGMAPLSCRPVTACLPTMARHGAGGVPLSQRPRTVRRSRPASRRAPLACISHHVARRSAREGRQDEARAAGRAQVYLTLHRARQASATKSWRYYYVLRPSGGEKCRLSAAPVALRAPSAAANTK